MKKLSKQEREHRDNRVVSDFKKGEKIRFLSAVYGISNETVYKILDKYGIKKRVNLDKK